MALLANTQAIIDAFELYAGDETELSSTESLALVNKKYSQVLHEREWEFLKKEASGTLSTSSPHINIGLNHSDFRSFVKNYDVGGFEKVVYITANYDPYPIVPFNSRRKYREQSGYVYYDARQNYLILTKDPTAAHAYEFDYYYVPTALDVVSENPVFPARFWDVIYHAMLIDNDIIQLSDKARREYDENEREYNRILAQMIEWDTAITNMDTSGLQ